MKEDEEEEEEESVRDPGRNEELWSQGNPPISNLAIFE
jgi:hypothetical protein